MTQRPRERDAVSHLWHNDKKKFRFTFRRYVYVISSRYIVVFRVCHVAFLEVTLKIGDNRLSRSQHRVFTDLYSVGCVALLSYFCRSIQFGTTFSLILNIFKNLGYLASEGRSSSRIFLNTDLYAKA